ncbi:hypothetical protein A1O1_00560 [Capronia coronata CBS 617.96]|uniref:Hemerythrin-like domain-containing protein n=1 Tax=Capronia coronata CBS 617.96 TaxID=1182541 RepID=W9ZLS9_9EURO|nr:uncharacterized protein A1O1_00560 [Capronia coronata CBS 617.96]EXJ95439.1 hypothetical protein A1O1_00560 [Capronia coronata CBS 617.96]
MATTPAYDAPITFSTVIDDDHNAINWGAGRLKRARTPSERARLLREVTWLLVRHDVSEDLVMRPAFIEHLGEVGVQMAEHDRSDHERAKVELLALFDRVRLVESDCSTPIDTDTDTDTDTTTSSKANAVLDFDEFDMVIEKLFADLLEHMKVESGEQIPALERILDPLESQRLGREYMKTQVLTPDLEIVDKSDGLTKRKVWRDVEDYARTDLAGFKEIYDRLTEDQFMMGVRAYYRQYVNGKL